MTETTTAKAYNVKLNILSLDDGKNAKGTRKITGRATLTRSGKQIERTFIAQGKAADAVAAHLTVGAETVVRVLFDRAPANDQGARGGEFLTMIDMPRAKAA
jgi:hypothetical protein